MILRYLLSKLKHGVARLLWEKMKNDLETGKIEMTEAQNQKWIHLQGQVLTRGRMKWDWKKVRAKST